jgi:hypothetical protein
VSRYPSTAALAMARQTVIVTNLATIQTFGSIDIPCSVKVLTGDGDLVARHVCERAGISSKHALLGTGIDAMTDPALAHVAREAADIILLEPSLCVLSGSPEVLRFVIARQLAFELGEALEGAHDANLLCGDALAELRRQLVRERFGERRECDVVAAHALVEDRGVCVPRAERGQQATVNGARQRATVVALRSELHEHVGHDARDLLAFDLVPQKYGAELGSAHDGRGAAIAFHAVGADGQ